MKAVIFNDRGETLNSLVIQQGANATINPEESSKRIIQIIADLLDDTMLSFEDINQYSLGIAGISDERARDFLFHKLDQKKISNKTHLTSDVNPIFEMNCSDNSAILLSIGTGIICLARGKDENITKAGGLGLEKDLGSGYWMGKELILNLSFSRNIDQDEGEFNELLDMTLKHYSVNELNIALDEIMSTDDKYTQIASIVKPLLNLAKKGNEIALSIVQQSSQYAVDYILSLLDQVSYKDGELLIIANGGIIRDEFYRSSLIDALSFDYNNINWLFPIISSAYYPGLLSCKILGIDTTVEDILKENPIE